jgi:hypothetical protein
MEPQRWQLGWNSLWTWFLFVGEIVIISTGNFLFILVKVLYYVSGKQQVLLSFCSNSVQFNTMLQRVAQTSKLSRCILFSKNLRCVIPDYTLNSVSMNLWTCFSSKDLIIYSFCLNFVFHLDLKIAQLESKKRCSLGSTAASGQATGNEQWKKATS